MPASTSIIRQFSAPTCDLKITAKNSLLSRWAGKSVLENLKFRLSFEKVNSGQESLTIRGNREQIESLYNTVSVYIRDLLRGSPEHLAINFFQEATPEVETPSLESETQAEEATIFFPNIDSNTGNANFKSIQSPPANNLQMLPVQTRMRSNGLAHELVLGSLETQKTGPSILLDFIELNDLATVLDDYYNQVTAIPDFGTSPLIQRPLIWAGSAAAILVAVGVTATAIRMRNPTVNSRGEVASVEELDPSLTDPSLTDPSLIDIPPLPMPELEGGLPSPDSEDGLDTLASPEGGINLIEPPAPEQPTAGSSEANSPMASSPIPTIPSSPQTSIPTRPNEPIVRQPSQAPPSLPQRSLPQTPSGAAVAPSAPRTGTTSQANRLPPAATPRQTPQVPPNAPTLPEFSPPSRSVEEIYGGIATAPNQTGNTPTTARVNPSPTNQNGAANIPQVAEVKRYFEQRWQPPSNLREPLEYLLYLNRDGSLQRILPLGETSKTNLDQTKIPLLNEPFVSSLSGEGTLQIRVVLGTDGNVETFLEGMN